MNTTISNEQRSQASSRLGLLVIFGILLSSIGCQPQQPSIPITGQVVFKNKPVFPGSVIVHDSAGIDFVANLDSEGRFRAVVTDPGQVQVAVKTHKLGNLRRGKPTGNPDAEEGSREAGVPAKFQDANVDIPEKYASISTSGLSFKIEAEGTDLGKLEL